MMKKRPVFNEIMTRLQGPRLFIQVLLGPRQVGKTTLALQAAEALGRPCHYASADLASLQDLAWLRQQWETARFLASKNNGGILIIDEVQKIPNWSDMIKSLWDADTRSGINLLVIILGSSPWLVQKGLTESLAGRFETTPITHWSFAEMREHFGWSLERYTYFGGYPGSVPLVDEDNPTRWLNYINDSLIETTISRDILLMTQVNKPALLRRLFQLGCSYSGQILSYTKMLGQLQDNGNTATLAHYLDLMTGAGLLTGLQKFSHHTVRQRGSIPKLCVFNTALMSAQSHKTFHEARNDSSFWGRLTESMVGAHLLNSIRGTQLELFYWRDGDNEVDFVLKRGNAITAIEVKSGESESFKRTGIDRFITECKPDHVIVVGGRGITLETFLTTPVTDFIRKDNSR